MSDRLSWIELGLLFFEVLAVLSIPSVLVQRAGRPLAALSWILAMVAVPGIGLFLWWAFGRRHLKRQRRRRQASAQRMTERFQALAPGLPRPPCHDPVSLLPIRCLPDDVRHEVFPATQGNRVTLLVNAEEAYPAMRSVIEAAEHHVHLLFYTWNRDATGKAFLDLLVDKARQGVEVRLLCDAIGSPAIGKAFTRALVDAGGAVGRFLPLGLRDGAPTLNFRNHRKILVVDGKKGFTGGVNIGDEYLRDWHDLAVQIDGPAVDQLQEVFADDWYFATGEDIAAASYFGCWDLHDDGTACGLVTSGPDVEQETMHDVLFLAINEARERVFIVSPYFIPNPSILASLRSAVYRGVDVRVMVPGRSDIPLVRRASRSFYPSLLGAGVRLFEYRGAILHAKAVAFDRELVLLGSANINNRSFRLNFEASALVGGASLNASLTSLFEHNMKSCRELSVAQVASLPWHAQVVDSAAHLLSPIL